MSAYYKWSAHFTPHHPSAVLYVALGSVSIDDTKIIEELVVSLYSKPCHHCKYAKQSYPECLCLFRHRSPECVAVV